MASFKLELSLTDVEEIEKYIDRILSPENSKVITRLDEIKEITMATQMELASDLAAIAANVEKIGVETRTLLTKISELQAALDAAGGTTPEVDAALAALKDQVTVVDNLVPDA